MARRNARRDRYPKWIGCGNSAGYRLLVISRACEALAPGATEYLLVEEILSLSRGLNQYPKDKTSEAMSSKVIR